jgi:anthranilate synthase component 1
VVGSGKVISRRVSSSGTADLLALQSADPHYYPFFLCSSANGTAEGRYDILMAAPGEQLWLDQSLQLHGDDSSPANSRFLDALDRVWEREAVEPDAEFTLPFSGGWFVFLAYELATQVERVLELGAHPDLPVAFAVRIPAAIVFDHLSGETWLVCEAGCSAELERMQADLANAGNVPVPEHVHFEKLVEDASQPYLDAVVKVKQYITAGDIYQANLARAWQADLDNAIPPEQLFARLIRSNPGPFSALARWKDTWILSSSPERLVSTGKGVVQTRPIAGTRPRGASP